MLRVMSHDIGTLSLLVFSMQMGCSMKWSNTCFGCDWEANDRTECWGKREKEQDAEKWKWEIGAKLFQGIGGCSAVWLGDVRAVGRAWLENSSETGGDNIISEVGLQGQKYGVNGNIFLRREYISDWEKRGYFQIMLLPFLPARGFVCLFSEFQLNLNN